jgi:lysyl-tRNA synthetase class II
LLAQYWGSFVDLKASIDIVSEDEDIDVSYDVYDSEEEANEGLAEEDNTAARRAPQAKAADSNSLAGGMSLFVNTAKVVRFHINENNGSEVSQILLNGEDITDQVVNGYFILANFGDINTLEIKAKPNSGVSDITVNDTINANTIVDVYNLSGAQVMNGVEMGSVSSLNLNAGIYIIRSANAVKKIVIR